MKALYIMDPFVDHDPTFDDRSFVAKTDLNAINLVKNIATKKGLKVSFAAISTILGKRDIEQDLAKNYVNVVKFEKNEIDGILGFHNSNPTAVLTDNSHSDCYSDIKRYFAKKLSQINPDIIIYWEVLSDSIKEIFPNTIFLEGSHSGFWTIEGNADIIFKVYKGKREITKFNKQDISKIELTNLERYEIEEFREFFRKKVLFKTQISRKYFDPKGKFKYFISFPGNFPSPRFKKYSGVSSNINIIKKLLNCLPADCAILYSPHHLDKSNATPPLLLDDRIIDLSRLKTIDKNITLRAIEISDAVVNVYSNIFMPAMTLGVPVFSVGNSPNSQFSLGNIEKLSEWLKSGKEVNESYKKLEQNTLHYILTRKINSRFIKTTRNSLLYLEKIIDNIKKNENIEFDCLPELSTVRGYTAQFSSNLLFKNKFNDSYKPSTYEIILGQLLNPNVKNIGFDIFDTLLCRPVVKPTDIFDLMEPSAEKILGEKSVNFSKSRVAAEAIARNGKIETSFDEIYDVIEKELGLEKEQRNSLQNLEREFERKYLQPRESILNLYRLAKKFNKRVFIASDMYFSKNFLKEVLEEKGYNLDNVNIYISCEEDAVKYDGSLFNKIKDELGIVPSETVFIGDNLKSDVLNSSEIGYISYHYPKAIDVLKENILFNPNVLGFELNVSFSFHIGFMANKLFDNPYISFDKTQLVNNSQALLGYMVFGPLVLSIVAWLYSEINNKQYDRILFSSRDSRVVIDVYDYIKSKLNIEWAPKSTYISISRTATLPAYCDKNHILTLLSLYNSRLSTKDFLIQVFDIDVESKETKGLLNKFKIDLDKENRANLSRLPSFLVSIFNEKLSEQKENIRGYFSQFVKNQKVACFDLGSKGTSRDILSDLFNADIDLYLFRTIRYKWKNNLNAYMQDSINPYRHGIRSVLPQFYELLLSDPLHKTCKGYENQNGKFVPIVDISEFSESSLLVCEAQEYIRQFCYEFLDTFTDHYNCINAQSRTSFIYPISYLCANTTDQKLLMKFDGDDPFWSNGKITIISNPRKEIASASNLDKKSSDPKVKHINNTVESNADLYNKKLKLINKINRNPEEFLRDSSVPILKRIYRYRKIPVIGNVLTSIAIKTIKTVLAQQKM